MLKILFFALIVRPFLLFIAGINLIGQNHLPLDKPCILAANHNSHLDTLVLMNLYPFKKLKFIRPVAAADYFLKNKWIAWFSLKVLGIIPLDRTSTLDRCERLMGVENALKSGYSIILFPEGSRATNGEMAPFKSGIAYLARDFPHIPVIPIYMHGTGKVLPKGEKLLVPFGMEVNIGKPIYYTAESTKQTFMNELESSIRSLQKSLLST